MDLKGSYLKLISCEENPSPIYIQYPLSPPLGSKGDGERFRKKKKIR
jgi:hypothetical protein